MPLTIGQVAKAADVGTETIRYYEREGLLPAPPRTAAGYRLYNADAVRRVRFMKRAQALGTLARACRAPHTSMDCPLLDALEDDACESS